MSNEQTIVNGVDRLQTHLESRISKHVLRLYGVALIAVIVGCASIIMQLAQKA